jgi:hypothetical protein
VAHVKNVRSLARFGERHFLAAAKAYQAAAQRIGASVSGSAFSGHDCCHLPNFPPRWRVGPQQQKLMDFNPLRLYDSHRRQARGLPPLGIPAVWYCTWTDTSRFRPVSGKRTVTKGTRPPIGLAPWPSQIRFTVLPNWQNRWPRRRRPRLHEEPRFYYTSHPLRYGRCTY